MEKNKFFKISNNFGELIKNFNQHENWVNSIQVIEDANKLISACDKNKIKIWDLQSGECLKTLNGHSDYVLSVLIYKNNKLISGSEDKTLKIWD